MNDPRPTLDFFDDGLRPYLPYLGAIAVDSARIEWGLSGLHSLLSNASPEAAFSLAIDRLVRSIREATRQAEGTGRDPFAREVEQWARRAGELLKQRGNLMHSSWLVESEPMASEELPGEDAVLDSPTRDSQLGDRRVFSRRMRGQGAPCGMDGGRTRRLCHEIHEHMQMYSAMWFAAGFVAGIWDEPR